MSDDYSFDSSGSGDLTGTLDKVQSSTSALGVSATTFAKTMSKAFVDASSGGKQFDDVLKQLAQRLSSMAVTSAFKPLAKGVSGSLGSLFNGLFSGSDPSLTAAMGAIKPFASGGVIGAPTYFPLSNGGIGLAGEAGPEAIMPLSRASDGSLGVAMAGAAAGANVTVQIATPDAGSFRRSEAYISGQIARAVARGQRSM
jgi:phage-related minor tail protein